MKPLKPGDRVQVINRRLGLHRQQGVIIRQEGIHQVIQLDSGNITRRPAREVAHIEKE